MMLVEAAVVKVATGGGEEKVSQQRVDPSPVE